MSDSDIRDARDTRDTRDTRDHPEFRPRRETPTGAIVIAVLVLLAAAFFGWRWYQQQQQKPAEPTPAAAAPNDAPAPPPPVAAAPTGPQNPVDALAPPDASLPRLAESDSRVMKALAELLGASNAETFLRSDGIVHRFVTTVDNLAREQAPANTWPVQPTGQRFITEGQGEAQTISANNAARYNAIVLLAQSIDPAKAAAVYARLYPLFQQSYEELGYPGRYFNAARSCRTGCGRRTRCRRGPRGGQYLACRSGRPPSGLQTRPVRAVGGQCVPLGAGTAGCSSPRCAARASAGCLPSATRLLRRGGSRRGWRSSRR
jgi:hypothetical protein